MGICEIARLVEVTDNAVLGGQPAGRNSLIVAVMANLNLNFIQVVDILAAEINHQLIFIKVTDFLNAMFAYRSINFDQAAFFQLLDMHRDGAIAEIQLLGDFIQVKCLIGGKQLKDLDANLGAQCLENINATH